MYNCFEAFGHWTGSSVHQSPEWENLFFLSNFSYFKTINLQNLLWDSWVLFFVGRSLISLRTRKTLSCDPLLNGLFLKLGKMSGRLLLISLYLPTINLGQSLSCTVPLSFKETASALNQFSHFSNMDRILVKEFISSEACSVFWEAFQGPCH